ncbi:MAG TPA: lysylphosphatidylglycerol synthase domain-containing protein [Bryobacteraceae bacterium]|nr:lysylphosphatidylglycerol synthase domain-containing protein [Bryobacteraceae bacterium]
MKWIRIGAALAGILLLGVLIRKLGSREVIDQLRSVEVALAIVIVCGALRLAVQTRAWQLALRADEIEVPQGRLVGIRLAAQAGGYLAALGAVVTEPAKLALMRGSAAITASAPATLAETGSYWFTSVVLGLAGTCAAAILIPGSRIVWLSAAVFAVAFVFLLARGALLSPIVRLAGARAPKWLRSAETTELLIRSFRQRRRNAATKVMALETVAQLLTLAEVAAVLCVAGMRTSALHILAIESAGRLVKILAAWVPARLGADEAGAAAAFAILGLPPAAGLTLALARRLRDLLFCIAGAAWAGFSVRRPSTVDAPRELSCAVLRGALTCKQ